ncbi:MAG: SDR family oxidoreductase [Candidatus Omnitrophica bacterium]|nr:SDR family oxidoreductase [Candidatus Omnitrophota bacterium]
MKVVVTGGAGFIGSHLTELLLNEKHQVTVIDNFSTGRLENLSHLTENPNLKIVNLDISKNCDDLIPHLESVNCVFHLAALADIVPSINRPLDYHKSNVEGTVNLLEACRFSGVKKLIYTASSSCYGIPKIYPTPEIAEKNPQYPYALTKYIGEQYAFHWAKLYGLEVVSLRLFNVYGPRSRTSGTYGAVFGVFLAQKIKNCPFTVVGSGEQTRDFVFVKDVARAFYLAAQSTVKSDVFNVGTSKPQSINRLVDLLGGEKVHLPQRPGEPDCTCADIAKIKESLNWEPEISFQEGVSIMIDNIDYWKNAPVWTKESIGQETKDWFKYLSK